MPSDKDAYEEKLSKLRVEYRESLPRRLREVEEAWTVIQRDGSSEAVTALYGLVHSLAGSGATFGYTQLSAKARDLEALVFGLREGEAAASALKPRIDKLVEELGEAARNPDHLEHSGPVGPIAVRKPSAKQQLVYWLGDDSELADECGDQLSHFCFLTRMADSFEALEALIAAAEPDAIVLDLLDELADDARATAFAKRIAALKTDAAIICFTPPEENMERWIKLTRAGAAASVSKALDFHRFLEKLDRLTYVEKEPPYRLLIVDDDKILANHTAAILSKAGMQVRVVTDPAKAMRPLEKFHPDLILMDLYMPKCSGLELAKIIRQDDRYLTTPIVYLSRETEVNKKLAALETGADDFMFKPVKYRYLYHALSARIKRARQLKAYMIRDGLTGLLNHTSLRDRLNAETARAAESNRPLTYALLDLDDFRAVNSAYGHNAGDRILKTFAILLRRHLGRRAHIGRLGGVEFGLVMPRTARDASVKLLDAVREAFAKVRHDVNGAEFQLTLSGGIAAFPDFRTPERLAKSAEKALLQAKSMGRNQLLAADSPADEGHRGTAAVMAPVPAEGFDDLIFLEDDELESVQEEGGETAGEAGAAAEGIAIAVVDDDRQVLAHIGAVLRKNGFDPHLAETGDEAFEMIKKHPPKVALIDLLLFPGIHGFELCQRIKEDPALKAVKIILMTAVYKDYRYRLEGKEAGADDFIEKPLDYEGLLEKIKALVA